MNSLKEVFRKIYDNKTPPRKFAPEKLKKSSTMITIDQVVFFFDYNMIKRETKSSRKKVSRKDKYLFNQRIISDKMLRSAFFLSKMTVINDGLKGDGDGEFEYNYLAFVEFLEFVARLAYYFFADTSQHTEWTLNEKLHEMFAWIFAPVDCKVVIPEENDEFQEESDDNY